MLEGFTVMALITGVVVPVAAVKYSVIVTMKRAKEKELEDERNQRIKLLHNFMRELELTMDHYEKKKRYYSKEPLAAHLIVNSPLFNAVDHPNLIAGVWDLLRAYQALDTAIDSLPTLIAPIHQSAIDLLKNPLIKWFNPGIVDAANKTAQETADEIIGKAAMEIFSVAVVLYPYVNKYLYAVTTEAERNLLKKVEYSYK
jgi:hypothetical protein